uniref:NR LBD domain-containing protein n=1 Tax=Plectus sambesii TaxID=2011161 RepID=A0A914W768_9BILA
MMQPFNCISASDQNALLLSFCRQHVLFNLAFRSRNETDCLLLTNGQRLPRDHSSITGMNERTAARIIDQLVLPMKFMLLDDSEYLLLKACILFNPVARKVSAEGADRIHTIRRQLCTVLEHYVTENKPNQYGRTNDLLLFFIGPLQALSSMLAEDIFITKLAGLAEIDKLIERLYLCTGDSDNILASASNERTA